MTHARMFQEYPVSLEKLSFFFIQVKIIQVLVFDNWHPLKAKNKNLFVCPLPTYSPKIGPTQNILLPFQFFLMFLSEDKLFSLEHVESNVFSFKP